MIRNNLPASGLFLGGGLFLGSRLFLGSGLFLGGAALQRCGKWLAIRFGFSRCGNETRPQRLKPRSQQGIYRSAEALRHPKAIFACAVLCALSTLAHAAAPASNDVVLRALREE